jgi:RimJ/RimL family protein N-acetyltransferase
MESVPQNSSPGTYPYEYEEWITLKNGSRVFLRPIKPTDRRLLVELFNRLSQQTIYRRFLSHIRQLPEQWLDRFTILNYTSDFALAATTVDGDEERIISVCRYHYNIHTENTELAMVVQDDWQNLGLGTKIASKVFNIARRNNIHQFEGVLDPTNEAITKILNNLSCSYTLTLRSGFFFILIDLDVCEE